MNDEVEKVEQANDSDSLTPSAIAPVNTDSTAVAVVDTVELNKESAELLGKIITENDIDKVQDLTYLFNINQNKKTMVRLDKLSNVQDSLVAELAKRINNKSDEISNQELMQAVKLVQDIIERGQKQVSGANDPAPLIQINNQDNSVNVSQHDSTSLSRDQRERVKNAVMDMLKGITQPEETTVIDVSQEEVDVVSADEGEDNTNER